METFHWHIKTKLEGCFIIQWQGKVILTHADLSVATKEAYDSMSTSLNELNYNKHCWQRCQDLTMTGLYSDCVLLFSFHVVGQSSNSKHYTVKQCNGQPASQPARQHSLPRTCNVKNTALLNPEIVLLPPLHIKLALLKNSVKGLDNSVEGFLCTWIKLQISVTSRLNKGFSSAHKLEKLFD
jgi:hypothetical protein